MSHLTHNLSGALWQFLDDVSSRFFHRYPPFALRRSYDLIGWRQGRQPKVDPSVTGISIVLWSLIFIRGKRNTNHLTLTPGYNRGGYIIIGTTHGRIVNAPYALHDALYGRPGVNKRDRYSWDVRDMWAPGNRLTVDKNISLHI